MLPLIRQTSADPIRAFARSWGEGGLPNASIKHLPLAHLVQIAFSDPIWAYSSVEGGPLLSSISISIVACDEAQSTNRTRSSSCNSAPEGMMVATGSVKTVIEHRENTS